MNTRIVNRSYTVESGNIVLLEGVEKRFTRQDLMNELRNIESRIDGIRHQNQRLIEEYNETQEEKGYIQGMLAELESSNKDSEQGIEGIQEGLDG